MLIVSMLILIVANQTAIFFALKATKENTDATMARLDEWFELLVGISNKIDTLRENIK